MREQHPSKSQVADALQNLNGDEYTLSQAMTADTANGGLKQMEDHYKTFITEKDFAEIAGAGLNWVRLPIPFNAFGTVEGEVRAVVVG